MVDDNGSVFDRFIMEIPRQDQKKMVALLNFLKQTGVINNTEKYKLLPKSDVVELKSKPFRLLAHRIKRTNNRYKYIILICFKKPKKKQQSREIEKAREISARLVAGNGLEI
jgi:hypothetical protein